MSIRAVIFDFGGVLCPMPGTADLEPLRRLSGIPEPAFEACFWRRRLDYDRGTLDGPAYWRDIAQQVGTTFSTQQIEDLIAQDVAMWQKLDPAVMDWVGGLKQSGVKTAILSNMPPDLARYLRSHAEWLNQFDFVVFSAELGLVKPDSGIYRACLEGLDVQAAETVFLDDIPVNVERARTLGINGIRFVSMAELSDDIQPLGLPLLAV